MTAPAPSRSLVQPEFMSASIWSRGPHGRLRRPTPAGIWLLHALK